MENEIIEQLAEDCETPGCWCEDGDDSAGFYWGNSCDGWNGPFATRAEAEEKMKGASQ